MGYLEDAFEARTKHGNRRVLARRGWAGEKRDFWGILSGSTAVKASVPPFFQQRDSSCQLRDGRLIDSTAGSLDEFCIESAMIDTGLARHGADEGAVLLSQVGLLVVERDHRLCDAFALTGWFSLISADQGIQPGYPMQREVLF
jgi:hypothetical protein